MPKLVVRDLILVNAIKGGAGKSLISFIILKYLISLKEKNKIFEFDASNKALSYLSDTWLTLEEKKYFISSNENYSSFFTGVKKHFSIESGDRDNSIIDGFIFPKTIVDLTKLSPYTRKVIYIIPNDVTINKKDLEKNINEYLIRVKAPLFFLINRKINENKIANDLFNFVKDILGKEKEYMLIDHFIPFFNPVERISDHYKEIGKLLL